MIANDRGRQIRSKDLGSWYGLILALSIITGVAFRAVQEERTLRAELPGYEQYMGQVKYQLIPYVW